MPARGTSPLGGDHILDFSADAHLLVAGQLATWSKRRRSFPLGPGRCFRGTGDPRTWFTLKWRALDRAAICSGLSAMGSVFLDA